MSDDIIRAYQELREWGTASVMVVRSSEMPGIYVAAQGGDGDAQMRLSAVGKVVPEVINGHRNCVLCGNETDLNDVAVMMFVSKEIKPGADALWCVVCLRCDEPDGTALADKAIAKMGFKRLQHEAGHA